MVSRKRGRDELETEEPAAEPTLLHRLQNMWQFANLAQYIHLFGDALKLDKDLDIEALEDECLKPQPSDKLPAIGLALLKHVSSFKGLTPEIFDEYTRRQYVAKAPHINPFGTDEAPKSFNHFDTLTKIRVLQQLSLWTLNNPNSIRERLNVDERYHTSWRIEPQGWDSQGRTLFVLDDNRLYRQTDPPPPPSPPPKAKAKPKAKSRKSRSTRTSKRLKLSTPEEDEVENDQAEVASEEVKEHEEEMDNGLGGAKWECLCITLEDYQDYMNSIRRSRDPDEKDLFQSLQNDVIPVLEGLAEEKAKEEIRRVKEREVELKLATAKRSSRLADKHEKQKQAEAAEEAERKRHAELEMARAEQEKEKQREEESQTRRMTREQRIREREAKRILHEEELRKMKEDSEKLASDEAGEARMSERHLMKEMKRRQKELEELQKLKEEEWFFDCDVCGAGGDKYDDGTHSIECERCNVWQHSKCHGISEKRAASDNFHFVCKSCKRKEEEAKHPKLPPLKLRLHSASPNSQRTTQINGAVISTPSRQVEMAQMPAQDSEILQPAPPRFGQSVQPLVNGPSLSPRGQALGPPGIERSEAAYRTSFTHADNNLSSPSRRPVSAGQAPNRISGANGFPASSPPQQPKTPYDNHALPRSNGSPWDMPQSLLPTHNSPFGNNFNRPASSAGPGVHYQSPVKNSPAASPRPANGVPNTYNFTNSPHSSFPPTSAQRPSFSPTKNSSPPPPYRAQMSSPAPAPLRIAPSPTQVPAQMLPDPIPAPEKHDGAQPVSSHSMSETPIFPPVKALSPSAKPQILSPPTKKQSPSPERYQFAPVSGNGLQQ